MTRQGPLILSRLEVFDEHRPAAPCPANAQIFPAGTTILRQGEPGTTLYVVVEGAVDVLVGEARVATIGRGGVVGEMAVITGQPISATVVARTKCWLAPIDEYRFADLVQHNPYFPMHLMTQLSERLQETDRLIAELMRSQSSHVPAQE